MMLMLLISACYFKLQPGLRLCGVIGARDTLETGMKSSLIQLRRSVRVSADGQLSLPRPEFPFFGSTRLRFSTGGCNYIFKAITAKEGAICDSIGQAAVTAKRDAKPANLGES
jgi:hypothetical protein